MMNGQKYDPIKSMVIFTIVLLAFSSSLFLYLYLHPGPPVQAVKGFQKEVAEGFGVAGFWALVVIYGRSILKIILKNGPLLQRFVPDTQYEQSLSISRKILRFLNQTHKYVGAAAVLIFITHALLMGMGRWNLFLKTVLFLLVWQGSFGLFLALRFQAKSLQKYSYLVHAQLFTGIIIAIFAGFGHLLV